MTMKNLVTDLSATSARADPCAAGYRKNSQEQEGLGAEMTSDMVPPSG
jgi:hypothetical protein